MIPPRSKNVTYDSDNMALYFQNHRRCWAEFYPSERWVFERVGAERGSFGRVLDVGCALGGLAFALSERFRVEGYTGVDINRRAIERAKVNVSSLPLATEFIAADICECPQLAGQQFDLVTALSVVDWNADATGILAACWDRVAPGGHLVVSLRLSPGPTICDVEKSYQVIWGRAGDPPANAERAQYTILNTADAIQMMLACTPMPAHLLAYGYWGKPSETAHTPCRRIVFTVFALQKPMKFETIDEPTIEAHLPASTFLATP